MKSKLMLIMAAALAVASTDGFCGETTNELKTVLVKMMCDTPKCKGEMKPDGSVLTSYPPQYSHQCTVCKTNRIFLTAYPEIRYEAK